MNVMRELGIAGRGRHSLMESRIMDRVLEFVQAFLILLQLTNIDADFPVTLEF